MGVAGLLCLLAASAAQAAPVTFTFNVKVDAVEDANGLLFGGVNVGDVVQGYLAYDSATADDEPGDTVHGFYAMQGGGASFGLLTPQTFLTDEFVTDVWNFGGADRFDTRGWVPISRNAFGYGYAELKVIDYDANWYGTDALPSAFSLAQLAGFDTEFLFRADLNDAPYFLRGHLTIDGPSGPHNPEQPPAVPEPTTLTLLGTGLVGLIRLRRRTPAA